MKYLLVLALILFLACSEKQKPTTYQIRVYGSSGYSRATTSKQEYDLSVIKYQQDEAMDNYYKAKELEHKDKSKYRKYLSKDKRGYQISIYRKIHLEKNEKAVLDTVYEDTMTLEDIKKASISGN